MMLWVKGEIVADDALKISVLDRTFEHGLGLFETLRTWNGRAVLLRRHLDRMSQSAEVLRLPLNPADMPDDDAVAGLIAAERFDADVMLRITLSGGTSPDGTSVLWMRARPLPGEIPSEGVELVPVWGVSQKGDRLASHKTLNYWSRRLAQPAWGNSDSHEALLVDHEGFAWEGGRTNLFAVRRGTLLTPPEGGPLLPGIMRHVVLERAERIGLPTREENLSLDALRTASELFMTNSVRGIVPVASLRGQLFDEPKTWTMRIRSEVCRWLHCGGDVG